MFEVVDGEIVRLYVNQINIICDTEAPRNRSASGYGRKVPTRYRVRTIDNRWRRVYCAIFSNAGTTYVHHNGRRTVVEFDWQTNHYKA